MFRPTDKHLPIVFESLYEELQEDGSQISDLWRQKSIKSRARNIGESCDPFVMPDVAGRIYSQTRLPGAKSPRCPHSRNYFPRYLPKPIGAIETYFLQLRGRSSGLTVGDEFSTGSPIWMAPLLFHRSLSRYYLYGSK